MRWSRKYAFDAGPIGDGYRLEVKEVITEIGSHRARVSTLQDERELVVTRIIIDARGDLVFGPLEEKRAQGYDGDWLPPLFSFEDLVATLLTSPYF